MICKKCGCRVSDTATFCDKCGASMTEFGQKEATVESVKKSPSTKKIVIAVVVLILCCALFVFPKTRQVSATNKAVTAIRVEKSDSAKVTEAYADFIGPDPVRVYVVLENGHDYSQLKKNRISSQSKRTIKWQQRDKSTRRSFSIKRGTLCWEPEISHNESLVHRWCVSGLGLWCGRSAAVLAYRQLLSAR